MKIYLKYLAVLLLVLVASNVNGQAEQIGSEVTLQVQSPHPYSGNSSSTYQIIWSDQVNLTDASYIALHFSQIELSKDDYVIVRNSNNSRFWKYDYAETESKSNTFWSIPIPGDQAIIELFSKNSTGDYGVLIDKVAKGYSQSLSGDQTEAICDVDDSQNAICYSTAEPEAYQKSQAVVRLFISGVNACTGWLVGNEGHILTNEH